MVAGHCGTGMKKQSFVKGTARIQNHRMVENLARAQEPQVVHKVCVRLINDILPYDGLGLKWKKKGYFK